MVSVGYAPRDKLLDLMAKSHSPQSRCVMPSTPAECVILVPVGGSIDPGCEFGA
jgi:hypothetical protein